ncbi:uncharacterized protein LOC125884107 [Epinephelus fuscoguttatus]|uniref:uncharacterized protein LOC125884107 n=1 Tax=Epinephelus fuscoguttatus TaxID=293821 RepID=UPI0020D0769D|nr:uncharacterized protein LOC125884107 [Epinephelus fuscoguttatus]
MDLETYPRCGDVPEGFYKFGLSVCDFGLRVAVWYFPATTLQKNDVEPTRPPTPLAEGETSGSSSPADDDQQHRNAIENRADDSATLPSTATALPVQGASRRRRPCSSAHQHYKFLERVQQTQRQWLGQQRELSCVREERILTQQLTQVVADTACSTGFLINQILTSLSHFTSQATPQPQHILSPMTCTKGSDTHLTATLGITLQHKLHTQAHLHLKVMQMTIVNQGSTNTCSETVVHYLFFAHPCCLGPHFCFEAAT